MADHAYIKDYITGDSVPLVGPEANRQYVEKILVEKRGYNKEDILVSPPLDIQVMGEDYKSRLDLVVSVSGIYVMVIRCAAGSLGSRDRETISAARIFEPEYQIPYSVVSDGTQAFVFDTITGDRCGEGIDSIPSKLEMIEKLKDLELIKYPEARLEREKIVFRSYDLEYVNVL